MRLVRGAAKRRSASKIVSTDITWHAINSIAVRLMPSRIELTSTASAIEYRATTCRQGEGQRQNDSNGGSGSESESEGEGEDEGED